MVHTEEKYGREKMQFNKKQTEIIKLKDKIVVYEVCEECHGNGFTKSHRLADKDIDTTYVCVMHAADQVIQENIMSEKENG